MRVDLVVPRFPPAHWNFAYAMDLEGSLYSHPPLGAATLAAHTPPGVRVRIFDENVEDVRVADLAEVVGITAMYAQRQEAFALARRVRAAKKRVLFGGGIVNALPRECAALADVVVEGEADDVWASVLCDLERGAPAPHYKASARFDMHRARVPRYDLTRHELYSTGSVQSSRGCPFACEFCDVPNLDGDRSRTKTIDLVMAEVEQLWSLGKTSTFFVDDHFLGDRTFALRLLSELARFGERVRHRMIYYCQATLNLAKDEEALEALYRANFRRVFIGIESDDTEALRDAQKKQNTLLPVVDAVRRIQRWNITVWCALLAGFDRDRSDVFDRYLRTTREAGIGMVIPGMLQAVPGTPYHDRIQAEGRLTPLRNKYVGGQAGSLDTLLVTNVVPKHMRYDELIAGFRRLCGEIYRPEHFGDRLLSFLEQGQMPELGSIGARELWAARGVLRRTARWYLRVAPPDVRRLFLRVLQRLLRTNLRRADEAIFHLVIYKHLREFYGRAASATEPLAADVERGHAIGISAAP